MGKNYAESSLKHYLKQKVRITLGIVVTFLITGAFAFAEGTAEKPMEEMSNFEKAEYYLQGINSEENKLSNLMKDFADVNNGKEENEKRGIKLDKDNNKIILENFNGLQTEISLNNENISNETAVKIKTALENSVENIKNISNESVKNTSDNALVYDGILENTSNTKTALDGNTINNGIIVSKIGQGVVGNQTSINNGIIVSGEVGQLIRTAKNDNTVSDMYNNGLIYLSNNGRAQSIENNSNNSNIYNNGIIINGYQAVRGGNENELYNYGIIENFDGKGGSTGQVIQQYNSELGTNKSYAYNYGIIKTDGAGQKIATDNVNNSVLKNYGVIENKYGGQAIQGGIGNKTENYGVIKSIQAVQIKDGTGEGFNYGTIINETNTVFTGKATNKGLIFLTNHEKGINDGGIQAGNNLGILFDKKGQIINDTQVTEYKGGNKKIFNTFDDNKKTAYVTGTGNIIEEKLTDKVIGTIVKEEKSEAVFQANKDIVLENTVITGYFEKNGTLLDMGNNNLTLLGDSKVVTSKQDFNLTGVNAININGILKLVGDAEVAGKMTGNGKLIEAAINGDNGNHISSIKLDEIILQNATKDEEQHLNGKENYTNVTYSDLTTNKVNLEFVNTAAGKVNTVTFTDNLLINGKDGISIDGRKTAEGNDINIIFSSLDSEKVKGDIFLGASGDKIISEKNGQYTGIIDMGEGYDTFEVSGFGNGAGVGTDHEKEVENTFDYKLNNVEKIVLGGGKQNQWGGWHIGENAELNVENGIKNKSEVELYIDKDTELHIDMDNNYGQGNVTTSLDKIAGNNDLSVVTGEGALVRFEVGDKFNVSEKEFGIAADYDLSKANLDAAIIFKGTGTDGKIEQDENGKVNLVVKEASEFGLNDYEAIYNAVLGEISENKDLRKAINIRNEKFFKDMITNVDNQASALYTTGYAVTKDVTDTYMSVVEDFGRKAGKGEWIAYGKYVNSDTEFDGGRASKGYDGDITGTVGMVEYGVNDTTSYGIVYGQGDTEVDIQGGGKLDGDNIYAGVYMKHRTQNGIDLTVNAGYTKNDLELDLSTVNKIGEGYYNIITDGNSDSEAFTFALKGTKDYKLSDSVRLQPMAGVRYSFINQDDVTSSDAKFRMERQETKILEGMAGGNIIKDFNISNGTLSLMAGAEFVLTEVSKANDREYTLYGNEIDIFDEEGIADNRIEGHIGAEYIHENGVGIDAKYEMIWTDKGDTDRITAGVSYRF